MSFKVKKWGFYGSVHLQDYYPDARSSYQVSPERQHLGLCLLFRGRVLFLCYDTSGHPIWFTYDPATGSFGGPYEPPSQVNASGGWLWYSPLSGNDRSYRPWGEQQLLCYGNPTGYGNSYAFFYGWDAGLDTWVAPQPNAPGTHWYFMGGVGFRGGSPARFVCVSNAGSLSLWVQTPGACAIDIADASGLYFYNQQGITWFSGLPWGNCCSWAVGDQPWPVSNPSGAALGNVFSSPPLAGQQGAPLACANPSGTTWQGLSGDAYVAVGLREAPYPTSSTYYASASDPLQPVTLPGIWQYRQERDGLAYGLDQNDLDGEAHGTPTLPIRLTAERDVSFNSTLGVYIGLGTATAVSCEIYGLDPYQPSARGRGRHTLGSEAVAWAGDYAIRQDLRLEHVLPMPDGYSPLTVGARPPEERPDGYILTNKHVYRRRGGTIEVVGPLKVDLTAYPCTSEDWDWPGSETGYHAGLWELFAGTEQTLLGRMPDYMFGRFFEGHDVMYGLGLPQEDLGAAAGGGATHRLTQGNAISGTSAFATPILGGWSGLRRHLVAARSGGVFCYCESGLKTWAPPVWKARAGRLIGGSWQSLVDWSAKGPPGLGETGWTVWSVAPIPPCRPLPQGGYLVGATLYFAPWAEGSWEYDAGPRDATFRDTGRGWVPSLPSWDGPFRTDDNRPIYYGVTDPSQASRTLYGPDALLVYDHAGTFVECLNSAAVYPPDGRDICVTWESHPKVIFRMYRWGTYSDDAEYLGQWHQTAEDTEIQAPLYCVYDLFGSDNQIKPGMGAFRGFVECYALEDYEVQSPSWRWSLPSTLYYSEGFMPGQAWYPAGPWYLRAGLGGRQVVPLLPGPTAARGGRPGPTHNTRI